MSETMMNTTTEGVAPTQAQAPSTDPVPFMNDDGQLDPNWHMRMGDIEVPENLKNVTDFKKIVTGWSDSQAYINKQAGEIGDLRRDLEQAGVTKPPEKIEGYSFAKRPEDIAESDWDQAGMDSFAEKFQKAGLSDEQASTMVEEYRSIRKTEAEAAEAATLQAKVDAENSLKEEWGTKYHENLEKAIKVAGMIGLDSENPEVGNSPAIVKALAMMADSANESTFAGTGSNQTGMESQMIGAREEARKIIQDSSHPYYEAFHNPGHPQHKDAHLRVGQLNLEASRMMKGRG